MSDEGFDWAAEAAHLASGAHGDADFYRLMARELLRDGDRLAVDFGCGGAGMAVALHTEATRRDLTTRIAGVDAHAEVFARAAQEHPAITFAVASFEDDATRIREQAGGAPDLIWARGALHHADDEQAALRTLAAVLAEDGVLAVAEGGTTVANLPAYLGVGEPGIQHRLAAAKHENYRRRMADASPMPYGWPIGLRNAGLVDIHTRNVLFDKPAPLEGADLDHVLRGLAKQVEWSEEFIEPADLAVWRRLLDPDDEVWLGHREDLFYLAAESVHIGRKPAV
ncbi:2-polyprenyl-3-methyl-5-hydroxy-6-metoxy-1,4-benzoquinol methylase [Stackebrandtia albiflava]|uniref:2-polyprenyl-3-methyl-5-hydroxy-6-metoxy-1, 4-benzoquinol methylase n=1 Tax=Stackebrandtia albiflava TaxID=406432 RepID=A0A562VB64_9ACTN|nr:methyltransferase [Stackebrandtia albiflava]TWJ15103.1 2-polyprenyl-3-methyl-5-hydroxy-6-metoxy-1,4-benzoquinol methylase [Stackebrandtia albiflava]